MKIRKTFTINFVILIAIVIAVPLVLGPGFRIWLRGSEKEIIGQITEQTDGLVAIEGIDGDYLSGITAKNMVVYSGKDIDRLPLITADKAWFKIPLGNLLNRSYLPSRIEIDGFEVHLYISETGEVELPDFKISNSQKSPVYLAGFAAKISTGRIPIEARNGIVEIHKSFPGIAGAVNISFFQAGGSGTYDHTGVEITEFTAEYLASPVKINGYVPFDEKAEINVTGKIDQVNLSSVFRNFEPIFEGSPYLPDGVAGTTINVKGEKNKLSVSGTFALADATLGNANITSADSSFTYSAGVIDLSDFNADVYGGTLTGNGTINLLSETPLWNAESEFQSVDIPGYLESVRYLKYEVTGDFSGNMTASGNFLNPDDMVVSIEIKSDGGKFLSPFCDRFMNLTNGQVNNSPVSEAELAVYTELETSAHIANSDIIIDRLNFMSDDLQIDGNGTIGFDKKISAGGDLSVPLDKAKAHPKFGSYVGFLPDRIGRVTLDFTISGTLITPKFSANPTENLLRGLMDQSSDILHDIGDAL